MAHIAIEQALYLYQIIDNSKGKMLREVPAIPVDLKIPRMGLLESKKMQAEFNSYGMESQMETALNGLLLIVSGRPLEKTFCNHLKRQENEYELQTKKL
ncbi:hypothetical protein [Pricia sp.]|uniref:hypothetical protein n=1 Tax=Pricia sp. TaxID=2268138 RepID=UPI0035937FDC